MDVAGKPILKWTLILLFIVAWYVGSYLIFSVAGNYAVGCTGLGQGKDGNATIVAKWYSWYPSYFSHSSRSESLLSNTMFYFYGPLYFLDSNYWHTQDALYTKKYKVVPFNGDTYISQFNRNDP